MDFEVLVQLKGEVLDPEGRAIQETLKSQGIHGVTHVAVAKRYVLSMAEDTPGQGETLARTIAETYLANPVAQTFQVRRIP
jgi:phosphoribosylformylglycinamidine synthase PurS subunit